MGFSREQIFNTLRRIKHPESGSDLVTLNLIEDLEVGVGKVSFSIITYKQNDPLISSVQKACLKQVKSFVGQNIQVDVNIKHKNIEKRPVPTKRILSGVKNIIAVASGKGGVGKSTIAVNLAVALANAGHRVGLIDADVYGPSVPKMFGAENLHPEIRQSGNSELIVPVEKFGVKMLSIGFFAQAGQALVWRGPMATSALKQLIEQGDWGELDYMLIDLPPGTGDVHLTIVQEVPVTGAVIVSTPQDVALADVIKGIAMFRQEKINVPVLGLIENMAWFTPAELPENKYYIFGKEGCKRLAEKLSIPLLEQIPIVQGICEGGDTGIPPANDESSIIGMAFKELASKLVVEVEKRNSTLEPTKKVEIAN
jgi:ATP-binding protein involved in chromosome partitioning